MNTYFYHNTPQLKLQSPSVEIPPNYKSHKKQTLSMISSDKVNFKGLHLRQLQDIKKIEPADVVVFLAHPDDEICFFSFISKIAHNNKKSIQLVYSTSGENGRDIRGVLPRYSPEIKMTREEELKTSLEKLGVKRDPIMLNMGDGKTRKSDIQEKMLLSLQRVLQETKAKEVYTFSPEGITKHPDHISIAEIVPDVVYMHKKTSRQKTKLFQIGFPYSARKDIIDATQKTKGVGLFIKVSRSTQDLQKKFNIKKQIPNIIDAFRAQTTQFTEDTVKALESYFKKQPYIYAAEKKIPVPKRKNVYTFTEKDKKRIEDLIAAQNK